MLTQRTAGPVGRSGDARRARTQRRRDGDSRKPTFLKLTRVETDGGESRMVFDTSGRWKRVDRLDGETLSSKGRARRHAFGDFLQRFNAATEDTDMPTIDSGAIRGYWFAHLVVAGTRLIYRSGPVVADQASAFAPLDAFLQAHTDGQSRIFT